MRYGWLLIVLLAACALPSAETPTATVRRAVQENLAGSPGAVVSAGGLQVSYPGESLFAAGAALPLPGGLDALEPLIDLLARNPDVRGIGVVRSSGHDAAYDRMLAVQRADLLRRIFRQRGISEERLELEPMAADGPPFELRFQPIMAEMSDGGKR